MMVNGRGDDRGDHRGDDRRGVVTAVSEAEFVALSAPMLRAITGEARRALYRFLETRTFAPSDVVCSIDAKAREPGWFVIVTGEVQLVYRHARGLVRPIEMLGPGRVLGDALPEHREAVELKATATTATRCLHLPPERAAAAIAAVPGLENALAVLKTLKRHRYAIFAGLRRMALFEKASPRSLGDLVAEATIVRPGPGEVLVHQGDPAAGFYYLIEGELELRREVPGSPPVRLHVLSAGAAIGDVAVENGEEPVTVAVHGDGARLLHVPERAFRQAVKRSASLRRTVNAAVATRGQALAQVTSATETTPPTAALVTPASARTRRADVVLPVSSLDVPLPLLVNLLAQAVAREHLDRVLLVELLPASASPSAPEPARPGHVSRARLPVPDDTAYEQVHALIVEHAVNFDVVLIDAGTRGPSVTASLGGVVDRVVHVARDTFAPPPASAPSAPRVIPTAIIGLTALPMTGNPYRAGTVRLRLDLPRLARLDRTDLEYVGEAMQASFGRWARAVTDRRIGVALGGGGVWGFAHVALLRALLAKKVPVDCVSGASFGSVVAAYFTARGRDGLDQVVAESQWISRAIQVGMVSLESIERLVNHHLGSPLLEELEVPFLPSATDIGTGSQRVISRGTIGRGVRASGSFPGFFAPTRIDGHRLVDGAIVNNVPDDVLPPEGAFLVVASNIVAAPPVDPGPRVPKRAALRFLSDLNPVSRMKDLIRGSLIMLHTTGDLDASQADIVFEPDPVRYMFWETAHGADVEEAARGRAEQCAEQIARRWDSMRGARADGDA